MIYYLYGQLQMIYTYCLPFLSGKYAQIKTDDQINYSMKNNALYFLALLVILSISFSSCLDSSGEDWRDMVPGGTSFLVIPAADATIQSTVKSEYIPLLEDISSSAMQVITEIDSVASSSLPVESILLYPGTGQNLQTIWITRADESLMDRLREKYARDFRRNEYIFRDIPILILPVRERTIYASYVNDYLFISESSRGIENAIRAYLGEQPGMNLTGTPVASETLIMNTPALDRWVAQFARVSYLPEIKGIFNGTRPAPLTITTRGDGEEKQFSLTGDVPLTDERSNLIASISHANKAITLDEYISSNAAAFAIFHNEPLSALPQTLPDTSAADQYLLDNAAAVEDISSTLGTEFGMVMYAESGFLSTGEYLFVRKLTDPEALRNQLEMLRQRNLINKTEGIYFGQSYGLAQLLGSSLCDFSSFYINIVDDAVVISKRRGLAAMIASDHSRRRVVTYEPAYEKMSTTFPDQMSSLFVAGPGFTSFLEPYLTTNHYIGAITSSFNYLSFTTRLNESDHTLAINLSTYQTDNGDQPFRENWIYNTGGAELSGPPAFGNFLGSEDEEVVAATRTGNIYVFASDGTRIQQLNTGSDVPVGSPVIYDWYGSGQKIVMIAAGNKIYGWDEQGELLPKFPFELSESITTPLTIADVNNNRIPDAIVGTANRRLHILNGRGTDIEGWPVTTNAPLKAPPLTAYYQSVNAVIAFSANAAHAWSASGNPLPGFPVFIDADFQGAPAKLDETIIGGAADGNLYGIGRQIPFADSLNTNSTRSGRPEDGVNVKSIYVANSAIVGTPDIGENRLVATSRNGAVFLMDTNGELLLTKNMGQPSAPDWPARIEDINGNNLPDIVALADYGRLYAWQIQAGERLFSLPTASMRHVAIGDLDGDGLQEVVAQTEEGIQCWTINR